MNVKATAKFIRIAPRKTRLVVDLVRGLPVEQARRQLMFLQKVAAESVLKVLNSAIANAQNNFDLDISDFVVTEAFVDGGPTIKRYQPRAHGRAGLVRKKMSHITIVVGPKVDKKKIVRDEVKIKEKALKPKIKKSKAVEPEDKK